MREKYNYCQVAKQMTTRMATAEAKEFILTVKKIIYTFFCYIMMNDRVTLASREKTFIKEINNFYSYAVNRIATLKTRRTNSICK